LGITKRRRRSDRRPYASQLVHVGAEINLFAAKCDRIGKNTEKTPFSRAEINQAEIERAAKRINYEHQR